MEVKYLDLKLGPRGSNFNEQDKRNAAAGKLKSCYCVQAHQANELLCVQCSSGQEEGECKCMAVKQVCPLLFIQRYYRIETLQGFGLCEDKFQYDFNKFTSEKNLLKIGNTPQKCSCMQKFGYLLTNNIFW